VHCLDRVHLSFSTFVPRKRKIFRLLKLRNALRGGYRHRGVPSFEEKGST
jgi:hypothetical protein